MFVWVFCSVFVFSLCFPVCFNFVIADECLFLFCECLCVMLMVGFVLDAWYLLVTFGVICLWLICLAFGCDFCGLGYLIVLLCF